MDMVEELLGMEFFEFVSVRQALTVVTLFIIADALMGIIKAAKAGEFSFVELPRFVSTSVLPYVGGLIVLAALAWATEYFAPAFLIIAGLIAAKYFVEIIQKAIVLYKL